MCCLLIAYNTADVHIGDLYMCTGKAFEGDASGSQARGNSMLYGLLNSDTTAVGGSTPMLKSLLATSAPRATKPTKCKFRPSAAVM